MKKYLKLGLLLLGGVLPSQAVTVWNEADDGDLSTDPLAPTAVSFLLGSNDVIGSVVSSADTRDYLTFSILGGQALTAITVNSIVSVNNDPGFSFLATGTTSVNPASSETGILGGVLVSPSNTGDDLLALFSGNNLVTVGFTTPLGAGDYVFEIQQTGTELLQYNLTFEVESIPEPSATLLGGLGSLLLLRRRRTNR